LQPKSQAEPDRTSWSDFCRLVQGIIAELSPCPEPTLFVVAATRGLQGFGDGTLEDLSKLLRQSVQQLQARGLVQINEKNLLIAPAEITEDDAILELTTVAGSPVNEDILELTTAVGRSADEDILLLTAERELHSSRSSRKLDEADANKKQQQTETQFSDVRKPAPEPTREEIIAAMRRFISEH
jgi:hypothetical protein